VATVALVSGLFGQDGERTRLISDIGQAVEESKGKTSDRARTAILSRAFKLTLQIDDAADAKGARDLLVERFLIIGETYPSAIDSLLIHIGGISDGTDPAQLRVLIAEHQRCLSRVAERLGSSEWMSGACLNAEIRLLLQFDRVLGPLDAEGLAKALASIALLEQNMATLSPYWRSHASRTVRIGRIQLAKIRPGLYAPEITGNDLEGKPMKLSQFRGKVVLLYFWGHW
jgi:hypothetical protein